MLDEIQRQPTENAQQGNEGANGAERQDAKAQCADLQPKLFLLAKMAADPIEHEQDHE